MILGQTVEVEVVAKTDALKLDVEEPTPMPDQPEPEDAPDDDDVQLTSDVNFLGEDGSSCLSLIGVMFLLSFIF
jgi:hypothetical protein